MHRPLYIAILDGLSKSVWLWIIRSIEILSHTEYGWKPWSLNAIFNLPVPKTLHAQTERDAYSNSIIQAPFLSPSHGSIRELGWR